MSKLTRRTALQAMLALVAGAADWTNPVDVLYDFKRCVSYRARVTGEFLVVQATVEPGWHTFSMDNKHRAEEKLAGRESLGIDAPTEIKLSQGLEVAGPWYQSPPKDFSKPDLRWFSWAFEGQAVFVAKVRRSAAGPAQVAIRGQACTDTICKQIDVAIPLPLAAPGRSDIDLKPLVRVR